MIYSLHLNFQWYFCVCVKQLLLCFINYAFDSTSHLYLFLSLSALTGFSLIMELTEAIYVVTANVAFNVKLKSLEGLCDT